MSGIRGSKNTEPTVKFYYADGPEEGFPWHRPQELVGRCRLGTTVTKTVLLAWLSKDKEVCYKVTPGWQLALTDLVNVGKSTEIIERHEM